MAHSIRYTYHQALMPIVEGALAANGYTITPPIYQDGNKTMIIATRGRTSICLSACSSMDMATLDILGADESSAVRLLESMPLPLMRVSQQNSSESPLRQQPLLLERAVA